VLRVLVALSEFERSLTQERIQAGVYAARPAGNAWACPWAIAGDRTVLVDSLLARHAEPAIARANRPAGPPFTATSTARGPLRVVDHNSHTYWCRSCGGTPAPALGHSGYQAARCVTGV
jgi:hypothetical protein